MKRFVPFIVVGIVALALGGAGVGGAQDVIKPSEAGAHVGRQRTVCGRVASAMYAAKSRGQPTFLNLDRPYPNHIFTGVIWGRNRARFGTPPETLYRDERICVSGVIGAYRGVPQIVVLEPSQISVK